MTRFRFRRLPVVSDDVLFGIITATDIMRYLGSREVFSRLVTGEHRRGHEPPGAHAHGRQPFHHYSRTPVNEAAREMLHKNIGALPVIENSRLVGLVTEFDLVRAFSEE